MELPQAVSGRVAVPRLTVFVARLLWVAMIGGQVALAVVFGVIASQGGGPRVPRGIEVPGMAVDAGMFLVAVVVTVVVRRGGRRGAAGDGTVRQRYVRRLLLPMAALEAPGVLGIFLVFAIGRPYPFAIVPLAAITIQLLLFPKRTVLP